MRIFLNKSPDGLLFDEKVVLPYEIKEQIEQLISEHIVRELENFGMPARNKSEMQHIFGQLQRDTRIRQKIMEWIWRGALSLLVLERLKEQLL